MHIHIYQTLRSSRIWYTVNFYTEFNRFEFRVIVLDKLPQKGWRIQSVLLFTLSWRENNWNHIFPNGISAMWICEYAMNNRRTQEDFFKQNIYLSLYCKGSKRVTQGLRVRGSWRPNRTEIFWPPLLWPSTLCLSCSPDAQPAALGSTLLGAGFLYCILSATSLVPKLHRGSRGHLRPGVAVSTTLLYNSISNSTATATWLLSWLSYIIVWNRMFDRHQAEITVMQFTGHSLRCVSLWVYHGNFFSSLFPLIVAIRMCHFLSVHHLRMAFLAGSNVNIQHLDYC